MRRPEAARSARGEALGRAAVRAVHARARRLLSSVIELTLELHGLEGARALVERRDGRLSLAALAGLPLDEATSRAVPRLVARGLDAERLGVVVRGATLALIEPSDTARRTHDVDDAGARAPTKRARAARALLVDGDDGRERVVALPMRAEGFLVDEVDPHLVGALVVAARAPGSELEGALLARLARDPGVGARARFALALVALRALYPHAPLAPSLFALAYGSLSGAPYGVALVVMDRAQETLDALLFGAGRGATVRGLELCALARAVVARRPLVEPARLANLVKREQSRARDFASVTSNGLVDVRASLPEMPRRPRRTVTRDFRSFVPVVVGDGSMRGAPHAQPDLFAP